jgi:hypothetical protein
MAPTHEPELGANSVSATEDRRRRPRLQSTTQGWVMPDGLDGAGAEPWEVRVHDVSRHGVGFESAEKFDIGQIVRIRIGRGPIELARRLRIVRCEAVGRSGTFSIGGEFV